MEKSQDQKRIVNMHQMLFEMARGNFNSRIPLSSHDDELETLVVLINMAAEEMKESIFQGGYVNPHRSHHFISQITFVLDESFIIKSFTPEVHSFLGYSESELLDHPLFSILTVTSENQLKAFISGTVSLPTSIVLDFITKAHLLVSVSCSIGNLINSTAILLSFITPIPKELYNSMEHKYEDDKPIKTRKTDALIIQKLYDYILAHLDEPLPSLKVLSRQFGTNEYKLKDGFRYFFKTSIYQFYNDERLKKAYFMIQNTAIPLKNISVMNGFNTYPNFSKAFKRRFGCSPYELKRSEFNL